MQIIHRKMNLYKKEFLRICRETAMPHLKETINDIEYLYA